MKKTFADAAYYLALINSRDWLHVRALEATKSRSGLLITTQWVLTEVGDALSAPAVRPRFLRLLDSLHASRETKIVPATSNLFREGCELFRQRPDKNWSLTDCISFIVMDKQGVREALTGDHHFEQAGFVALLAEEPA